MHDQTNSHTVGVVRLFQKARLPAPILGMLMLISGCGTPEEVDSVASMKSDNTAPVADAAVNIETNSNPDADPSANMTTELATFGGGCFWCTEAVFQRIDGVEKVVSGYSNGDVPNPTYDQVCSGRTGHAEVIQITYNPAKVPYVKLLEVFFMTHNPTTLNQQGADRGTQYRSGVYYHSDEQRQQAQDVKKKLDESGAFDDPIVTEIVAIDEYYPAEGYHQNYYNLNANNDGYCQAVIVPKVEKFKKTFADLLKDD